MITTYGKMPDEMPRGYFKAVSFPILALLDTPTGDGRQLASSGAGTRELPLTIRGQFNSGEGHGGAVVTGALFEVSVDPDTKVLSGRGFLLNDEFGRRHARMIYTKAMRGNSVDLADVTAQFQKTEDGDHMVLFSKFNLAATTGVATPAFAAAYAEVDEMSDDELMASLVGDDPLEPLVAYADDLSFSVILNDTDPVIEVTASSLLQEFDAFYMPEAAKPQKIVVDENRRVYGHLGLWESCHDGIEGRCIRIPRPQDSYASFNKPGVLTERGMVETGPIFAFGGHRSSKSAPTLEEAYGGIENAWADVRITEGRFGPWISGVVRPGVPDEVVYVVRASRISGHWVGGRLKAIVSVNSEGYDVPGSGLSYAPFAFSTGDEGVMELVASFPTCMSEIEVEIEVNIGGKKDEGDDESECPEATQSIEKNLENRQTAIDGAAYGPLNPDADNEDFWQAKADRWQVTISEAQQSTCGNCAAFIQTTKMMQCIVEGLGEDSEGTAEAANLGYCEIFDFKCAGARTCDAWISGGPITDANMPENEGDLPGEYEPVPAAMAAVNLTPPRGAQAEARRGLQWVADGHGGDGLEQATIGRARSMARGEARSPETVRRMRDFFNRHQSDKKATGWRQGEDGYPSPGRVAWALWGGDTGWSWAKRKAIQLDNGEAATLGSNSLNEQTDAFLMRLLADE